MTSEELLGQLYDETLVGNKPAVLELTNQGLAMGLGPETLLYEALIPSLEEVGARFERGDFFVPEMLIAGKAMAGALEILRPLLAETGAQTIGTIVMGTVKGDVHDIGKNLVNIMFEGAGFQVIDLGVQVAPEKFIEAIKEHKPDIVGFSAFLTTTMPMFKANINALQKSGLRDQVIVMVGGAPVTQEYADVVGADGYAADASAAVARAKELLAQRRATVSVSTSRAPEGNKKRRRERPVHTILSSATKTVRIGDDQPFAIIGERINPTGRKIFQLQLRNGDLSRVEIDVQEQVAGGAMLLDVNMGAPLADEAALMTKAVTLIQSLTDLPLVIDSSIIEVLDAGLAAYQGKALVNSVTAEDERLDAILPLVKKYGAAVIGLPNDEEEIPEEPARRVELARKLIHVATEKYKIPSRGHRHRPAGHAGRRGHLASDPDAGNDRDAQGRVRGEHDTRCLERELRHAGPALDRRRVPAHRHQMRADQRHHGRALAADRPRGQGGRPGAEPGRVGRRLDRRPPRPAGQRAGGPAGGRSRNYASQVPRDGNRGRSTRARSGQSAFQRTARAGSVRRDPVRRGQLERHRDRFHLRRPRYLQEVPDQDRRRPARADQPGYQGLHRRRDQGRLAAGLPHDRDAGRGRWRCRR